MHKNTDSILLQRLVLFVLFQIVTFDDDYDFMTTWMRVKEFGYNITKGIVLKNEQLNWL